jgi:hypothetical protein
MVPTYATALYRKRDLLTNRLKAENLRTAADQATQAVQDTLADARGAEPQSPADPKGGTTDGSSDQ